MKAAVFYQAGDLRVEEREMPVCGAGQVLLRVRACGICGTDAHIFCGDEGLPKRRRGRCSDMSLPVRSRRSVRASRGSLSAIGRASIRTVCAASVIFAAAASGISAPT